jgi:hypothetical protein
LFLSADGNDISKQWAQSRNYFKSEMEIQRSGLHRGPKIAKSGGARAISR